jgi:DDE superfamily endonuclease
MHDYELLKEDLHWYDGQKDWFAFLEIFVDLGFVKIDKEFQIGRLHIPIKRKRGKKGEPSVTLTEEQKAHNKQVSQTRVLVEHAIGGMKHFNIMTHVYRNRRNGFEDLSVGLCAALQNLSVKLYSD